MPAAIVAVMKTCTFPPRNVFELTALSWCWVIQATGDIYSGSWVANNKSGQGMYQFGADNSTMHGTWVEGTITEGKWVFKVNLNQYNPRHVFDAACLSIF